MSGGLRPRQCLGCQIDPTHLNISNAHRLCLFNIEDNRFLELAHPHQQPGFFSIENPQAWLL